MNFLVLFGVTVLFQVVKCEDKKECWISNTIGCTFGLERTKDSTFCGRHKQQMYCIANPAIECDMSFKQKALNLKQTWESICEKNTNTYKELDENIDCIMTGLQDPKCIKSAANSNEVEKEACRHFDESKECQLQSVTDNCGQAVASLYKTVFGPVNDVERAVCDDIILPG